MLIAENSIHFYSKGITVVQKVSEQTSGSKINLPVRVRSDKPDMSGGLPQELSQKFLMWFESCNVVARRSHLQLRGKDANRMVRMCVFMQVARMRRSIAAGMKPIKMLLRTLLSTALEQMRCSSLPTTVNNSSQIPGIG